MFRVVNRVVQSRGKLSPKFDLLYMCYRQWRACDLHCRSYSWNIFVLPQFMELFLK